MTGAVASFLFASAWKGTLLVAFALLVYRVSRNRVPSRWLCALLLVALVRLVVPVAPPAPFSVFNLLRPDAPSPVLMIADETPMRKARALAPRTVAPPPSPERPWIPLALALWGAGVVFVVARAASQTRRFRRQLARGTNVDRDDVLALVDECRTALNVGRRVRVVVTSAVATPSLHGWLRPALLLPEGFLTSFTREQLRYVVLHELAHLRRSDVLVNWIVTAAHALHWFNPLVRVAVARLAEERELACDALALAALRAEERPAYGGTVLELVDRMRLASAASMAPAVPALVGMTATPEQLKRRIVMIASFRPNRFSIVFAALVVALGLVTLTDARAGERKILREKMRQPASPAIQETMRKLETKVQADLKSATLDELLHTVMNATGASIVVEEGALDDAARAKRLDVGATNVPAHLVLFESLSALDLSFKFTEAGVVVQKAEAHGAVHMRHAEHEVERTRLRSSEPEKDEVVRKIVEITGEHEPGSNVRKLTLRDGEEVGTLTIEVKEP
jgi:bla regulator protein BlaR1